MVRGRPLEAARFYGRGAEAAKELSDGWDHSIALGNIADAYLHARKADSALTYFDLARQYGGSLAQALNGVRARTLLIAFSSDWLYPPSASREIADTLVALGKPVEFHVIEAPYGHDCFLLEEERQTPIIQRFLERGTS